MHSTILCYSFICVSKIIYVSSHLHVPIVPTCLSKHFVILPAATLTPSSWVQNSMAPTVPFPTSSTKRMSLYLVNFGGQAFEGFFTGNHVFLHTDAEASKNQKDFYWVHLRGCVKLWSHTPNVFCPNLCDFPYELGDQWFLFHLGTVRFWPSLFYRHRTS